MHFYKTCLQVGFTWLFLSNQALASNEEQVTLVEIKQQIEFLKRRVEQLEREQVANTPSQKNPLSIKKKQPEVITKMQTPQKSTVNVYATLRPTFGYIDEQNIHQWGVRDALSHAGFKFTHEFQPGWTAEAQGEWGVDLSNNGNFGKARRAYVAVDSPYGRVGIGKQRPPQYLLIAEYVDIFNHANSPFSYDPESLFFVNNLVTYKFKANHVTWLAASQFNGENNSNNSDLLNLGMSYDEGSFHAALTYLNQDSQLHGLKTGEDNVIAGSIAYKLTGTWYLAAAYQHREYQDEINFSTRRGHTFDLSSAYQLSKMFKLKLGYFDFDDGYQSLLSRKLHGYNTTLEWLPAPMLRFHLEYLNRDFDYLADFSSWSVGFRYDFAQKWQF